MTERELYIVRLSAWAPGIESAGEWDEWAQGKKDIAAGSKGPEIGFTEPLFRRRLSQISKMTIQVIHDLLPLEENTKLFFISFRGELSRQYQINKMLIEEKALMPAAFSLSVFNTPVALASIALGLRGGYSAIYPAETNPFAAGIAAAEAALLCGTAENIVFVYADEDVPEEYKCFYNECPLPAAFGFLLSRKPENGCQLMLNSQSRLASQSGLTSQSRLTNPLGFLKELLLCGKIHVSS